MIETDDSQQRTAELAAGVGFLDDGHFPRRRSGDRHGAKKQRKRQMAGNQPDDEANRA